MHEVWHGAAGWGFGPGKHGMWKCVRKLLAAMVLALPVAFGWPVQAAAQERVLVSNIGQPDSTAGFGFSPFAFGANLIDNAQKFTTGSNAPGYRVSSVEIEFAVFDTAYGYTASIRRNANGAPGAIVGTLQNPSFTSFTTDRVLEFTAPTSDGILLEANTDYFVVIDIASLTGAVIGGWRITTSNNEDSSSLSGWRIDNKHRFRLDDGGDENDQSWQDNAITSVLKLRLKGRAVKPAGLAIAPDQLRLPENGSATYTVALDTEPTHNVTVTVAAAAGVKVDTNAGVPGDQNRLTFTAVNWNKAQTVTVSGVADSVDNPGGGRDAAISHAASSTDPNYTIASAGSIGARVTDDDPTTVTLSGAAGDIEEGQAKEFTIALGRGLVDGETLTAPLTFGGTATRGTDYTMTGTPATGVRYSNLGSGNASVVFTGPQSGATATTARITLSAASDNTTESASETVDIAFGTIANTGLTGAGGVSETDSLAEFNISDPPPDDGVTVSTASLTLTELGATMEVEKTYTLVLDTDPGVDVTITVSNGDGTAVEVDTDSGTGGNQNTLTFTAGGDGSGSGAGNGNWAVAQTVTVRALNDADGANESFNLTMGAAVSDTGNPYHGIAIDPVAVTTTDAGHGVIVSESSLSVAENDETAEYTVVLKSQPSGNVVISATSGATTTATVSPASLTFTNADWNMPQTFTVTGKGAGSVSISHTVESSADTTSYPTSTTIPGVSVTVTADTRPTVTLNPSLPALITNEGENAEFMVILSAALGADVTIPVTVTGLSATAGDDYTAPDPGSVTITAGQTEAAFTIVTINDDTLENDEVLRVDIDTANLPGTVRAGSATMGSVIIVDNDEGVLVSMDTQTAPVREGESLEVSFTLAEAQGADVRIPVVLNGVDATPNADFTNPVADGTAADFTVTIAEGDTTGSVTVTTLQDTLHEGGEDFSVQFVTADGVLLAQGLSPDPDASITAVTILDDDGAVLTETSGSTVVGEDGTTDTYQVRMNTLHTGAFSNTTIMATAGAGAGAGLRVSPAGNAPAASRRMNFTASALGNQTVHVHAVDDDVDNPGGSRTGRIMHTATSTSDGGSAGLVIEDMVVAIADDDPTTVTLSGVAGDIEEGQAKEFTIVLGRGLVNGETLTVPLTFGGTAARGTDYTMTGAAATGVRYNNLDSGNASVVFTGLQSGATATTATLTLSATSDSAAESPPETVDIAFGTITDTGLGNFGGVSETDGLDEFNISDPPASDGVTVSTTALALTELGEASDIEKTYTIVLDTNPGAAVTVTVTNGDNSAAAVDTDSGTDGNQNTLTFTAGGDGSGSGAGNGNWAVSRQVTVRALNDGDAQNEAFNITHSASAASGPYNSISIADVAVTTRDAGHGVVVSASRLSMEEDDEQASYDVVLKSRPGGTVAISVASNSANAAVSPATLSFGDTDWNTPKSVTVTGKAQGTAWVSHQVSTPTAAYPTSTRIAPVWVRVTAEKHLTIDPAQVRADSLNGATIKLVPVNASFFGYGGEGGTPGSGSATARSYVVTTNIPKGDVALSPAGLALIRLSGAPAGLTITAGRLLAIRSVDGRDHRSVAIDLAYTGPAITVDDPVTVTVDGDLLRGYDTTGALTSGHSATFTIKAHPGLTILETDGDTTVSEDGTTVTDTYSVALKTEPTHDVTVTATAGAGALVSAGGAAASTATLRFTTTNWSEAQTVTVTGADDNADNAGGGRNPTISHAASSTDAGYTIASAGSVEARVTDDDATMVTLASAAGDIEEGQTKEFTVTLGRGLVAGEVLTVPLTFGGAATRGADYTMTGTTAAGVRYSNLDSGNASVVFTGPRSGVTATTATITLSAASDSIAETTPETVDIGLGATTNTGLTGAGGVDETDSLTEFNISDPSPGAGVTVSTISLALTELGAANLIEKSYTLVLDTDPGADVTITVANGDSTAVEVDTDSGTSGNQNTLTFTHGDSGNWNTARTVTVRALNDGDAQNESFSITHGATAASGPYSGISIGSVAVTTGDAGHGVVVSRSRLSVAENDEQASYDVVLKSRPGGTVAISVASNSANAAVSPATLSFGDADWNRPKTVVVTGKAQGTAMVSHAVSTPTTAYPASTLIAAVAVRVAAHKHLSLDPVEVQAGSLNGATITLAPVNFSFFGYGGEQGTPGSRNPTARSYVTTPNIPRGEVALSPAGLALIRLSGAPAGLTITAGRLLPIRTVNGRNHRSVEIDLGYTGQAITVNDPVTVTVDGDLLRGYDTGGGLSSGFSAVFTIRTRAAAPGITFLETHDDTTVSEDGSTATDTYGIALNTEPTHDVTVTVTAGAGAQVASGSAAASTATLTFTSSNWRTAQTVTVSGVADSVDNPGGGRDAAISHAASSTDPNYTIASAGSIGARVTDDDPTTVTLSGAAGDIEEGQAKEFTIALGRGLVDGETLTAPLTFGGTATRGTDYTMTGTPATGVRYSNLGSGNASVVFTGPQSGATATTARITLSAASDNTTESAPETVDIAFGTIANTGLTGAGGVSETDSLTEFGISDPLPAAGVTVSTNSLTLTELGAANVVEKSYTVVLDTDPGVDVTVMATVPAANTSDAQVKTGSGSFDNSATLTFTHGNAGNWNTARTVTVRALNDGDASGESFSITHSATATGNTAPYHGIAIDPVAVTLTDAGHGVVVSESMLSVEENDGTATYTVALKSQPSGNVVVSAASGATVNAEVDTDTGMAGNQNTLTFTNADWNMPQPVTVTGKGRGSTSITHAVSSTADTTNYPTATSIPPVSVTVTITDDDGAGVTLRESGTLAKTEVSEDGTTLTDTYTVALNTEPTHNVTITVTAGAGAKVDTNATAPGDQNTLTFTPGGTGIWSTAQTVRVIGVPDSVDNPGGGRDATLAHAANSTDANYQIASAGSIMARVTDDEPTTVTLGGPAGDVNEGRTKMFTVTLNRGLVRGESVTVPLTFGGIAMRNADYTLAGTPADGVRYNNLNAGSASVVFTGPNAGATATAATITLSAVADNVDETGPESVVIGLGAVTETGLANFGGANQSDSLNDFNILPGPGVKVSTATLALTELGDAGVIEKTYTLVLESDPEANVTITVTNGDSSAVEVDTDAGSGGNQSTLTFTHGNSGNWSTAQPVTVRALNDGDASGESFNLTHAATVSDPGNDYHGIAIDPVAVTLTDAGHGVVVSESMLSVKENDGTATYAVVLKSDPGGTLVIGVTPDSARAMVSAAALTFTSANWFTPQMVTVTGKSAGPASVNHSVTTATSAYPMGTSIDPVAVTVTVTVTGDNPSLVFTETAGDTTVKEGGSDSDSYAIALSKAPTADVTVTVSAGTGVQVNKAGGTAGASQTLTFTTTSWNTPQTITVTGVDDNIDSGGVARTVLIGHAANSSDTRYNIDPAGNVSVTVREGDALVTLANSSYEGFYEGDTVDVQVNLSRLRPVDVVVEIEQAGGGSATAGTDFTAGPWSATVPKGQTSAVASIALTDDTALEPDERFNIRIRESSLPDGVVAGAVKTASVDILDNEYELAFDSSSYTVNEHAGEVELTLTMSKVVSTATAVFFEYTDGTAVSRTDYTRVFDSSSNTATIAAFNRHLTLTIPILPDFDSTSGKRFTVTARPPSIPSGLSASSATVDIASSGLIITETGGTTVMEDGSDTDTYTIALENAPDSDVTVTVTSGDTGAATVSPGTLTFSRAGANLWSTPQTVTVTGVDDPFDNAGDRRIATIRHAAASMDGDYGIPNAGTVSVTVIDDDERPQYSTSDFITLSADADRAGPEGTRHVFTVVRNVVTDQGIVSPPNAWGFQLCFGGTALPDVDYTIRNHRNLPLELDQSGCSRANDKEQSTGWSAGRDRAHFYIRSVSDDQSEGNESIVVTLVNPVGTSLYGDNGVPYVKPLVYTVKETPRAADTPVQVPSTLAACVSAAQWKTVADYYDSNAGKSPNYGANWYRALIAYGEALTDRDLPDWTGAADKPTEPYTVKEAKESEKAWSGWTPVRKVLECLEAGSGTSTSEARAHSDGVSLSVADATVTEGAGAQLAFTVRLSGAAAETVTVDHETRDLTATRGADYSGGDGALRFLPGEVEKQVTITVLDDAHDEGRETLELVLSNAVGANIDDGVALGTIVNSDPLPQAWLARFGRGLAQQVVDGVSMRRDAPRTPGFTGRIGNVSLGGTPGGMHAQYWGDDSFRRADLSGQGTDVERDPMQAMGSGMSVPSMMGVPSMPGMGASAMGMGVPSMAPGGNGGGFGGAFPSSFGGGPAMGVPMMGGSSAMGGSTMPTGSGSFGMSGGGASGMGGMSGMPGGIGMGSMGSMGGMGGMTSGFPASLPGQGPGTGFPVGGMGQGQDIGAMGEPMSEPSGSAGMGGSGYDREAALRQFLRGSEFTMTGVIGGDSAPPARHSAPPARHSARSEAESQNLPQCSLQGDSATARGMTASCQVVPAIHGADSPASPTPGLGIHAEPFGPQGASLPAGCADRASPATARGMTESCGQAGIVSDWLAKLPEINAEPAPIPETTWSLWGSLNEAQFRGDEGALGLEGSMLTGMFGGDVARDNWLAGVGLNFTEGLGSYRPGESKGAAGADESAFGGGDIRARLAAVTPYGKLRLAEGREVWGTFGVGTGTMELAPGGDAKPIEADLGWQMAAVGGEQALFTLPQLGGLAVSAKSDLLWARTTSDDAEGLIAASADVSRARLGLEGSWNLSLGAFGDLRPTLEAGVRHDAGDAETGFGVDVGGGIAWRAPELGLDLSLQGRGAASRESGGFRDWSYGATMTWDPDAASEEGLLLKLGQDLGGATSGLLQSLFSTQQTMQYQSGHDSPMQGRWTAEAEYGLALPGKFLGSPKLAFSQGSGARDYTLGWRLKSLSPERDLSLELTVTRSQSMPYGIGGGADFGADQGVLSGLGGIPGLEQDPRQSLNHALDANDSPDSGNAARQTIGAQVAWRLSKARGDRFDLSLQLRAERGEEGGYGSGNRINASFVIAW